MPNIRTRVMKSIKKHIELRAKIQEEIAEIERRFQPKLDKIVERRERTMGRRRTKVRDLTVQIQGAVYNLSGTEIAHLRNEYPELAEVRTSRAS